MGSAGRANDDGGRQKTHRFREKVLSSRSRSEPTFAQRVYALVRQVPRGRVITYGAIARLLGSPTKAREVGWAMAVAPEGVPFQRVINARGAISGGHAAMRRKILEADGVILLPDGRVDLDCCLWLPEDASGGDAPAGEEA